MPTSTCRSAGAIRSASRRSSTLDKYDLLAERVRVEQALWNEISRGERLPRARPGASHDPNKNRSGGGGRRAGAGREVRGDGQARARRDGDTLADPTTRMEYDLFNWMTNGKPNFVHAFARERHGAGQSALAGELRLLQRRRRRGVVKAHAHPGKALRSIADGSVTEVDADPRWIGNGRTILNNKGSPVKQYEPYFSTTHEYESEEALRELGVTPILFYDAIGRNVRTDYPDGTFARVEFTPGCSGVRRRTTP